MNRLLPVILCVALFACKQESAYKPPEDPLFLRLQPSATGVDFVNKVHDSAGFNVFNYRNFYNGGGVAIGDINNDGLPDLFFTANQGLNQLYLNKGNWKFENITKAAGVGGTQSWSTGVTMADVNGDGYLDIYVCNSGDIASKSRNNELYINQKNGTFKEEAAAYGLQDADGLSTHAAFFDYDGDGDLDCYVLNNSYRPIESFGYNRNLRNVRDKKGGDKLFRNDGNSFTDVSEAAGIYGSEIGFGMGISVADVNGDKWPDLFISNDFFERDYLYLNQQNGTFKEVLEDEIGHISLSSMGSDMADINNDGLVDIFTTDMLPESDFRLKTNTKFDEYDVFNAKLKNDFHHQFTRNMLQLNNGDGTFSEIGQFAGVYQTDWSWGALIFDFQNDGWKDIFVSNGISKDLTDQDFIDFMASEESIKRVKEQQSFNFAEFLDEMKSTKIANYGLVNQRNLRFDNKSYELGLAEVSFSNGSAYGDLDNDGDLDLVVNNENMDCFVYRNQTREKLHNHFLQVKLNGSGMNRFGIGAEVTVFLRGQKRVLQQITSRGFESSVDPLLHFGLGDWASVDSVQVIWPDRKLQVVRNVPINKVITINQSEATMNYVPVKVSFPTIFTDVTAKKVVGDAEHKENVYIDFDNERLMPWLVSIEGPKCASGDINGDSLEDIVIGGSKGDELKLLIQQQDNKFLVKTSPEIQSSKTLFEDAGVELVDIDNDKDLDLLIASGGNETGDGSYNPHLLRTFLNDGKGNFTNAGKAFPIVSTNASVVRSGDYDGDGDEDIFL
ncbi:MAG TPA: VCBS repeat-containing protein, partial [Flavitalea sp.]|nr:VCBS repeat-containing protein [Flavitalea sp.]